MKIYRLPLLVGLVVSLIVILFTMTLYRVEQQRHEEELHAEAMKTLGQVEAHLETGIYKDTFLSRGLIAYVVSHPKLDDATFQKIAANIFSQESSIRNIGLAPGNILSFVYPKKGNENAIGLDYTKMKEQWHAVKKAMDSRETVFTGPVNLVQGGRGIISRSAIFLDSEGPQGINDYWGQISVVIDYDELFKIAGFYDSTLKNRVAIRDSNGRVFEGDSGVFLQDPVLVDVEIQGINWQLGAVPLNGWNTKSTLATWLQWCGLCLAMLAGVAAYTWTRRMIKRQKEFERSKQRTEDALAELLENRQFLAAIFENIPNTIFIKDAKDLKFIMINRAVEELTGFTKEEMLGKSDYDLIPKEQADFFTAKDREVLRNKQLEVIPEEPLQTRHRGTRILLTKKIPLLDDKGTPQYLLGISEDITDQKKMEEAYRNSAERFKIFFSAVSDAVFVHPMQKEGFAPFIEVNDVAIRRYGYSREEFMKLSAYDITLRHSNKMYDSTGHRRQLLESGRMIFEAVHVKKSGEEFPVEINSSIVVENDNPMIMSVVRDISERKKAEEERAKLEEQLQQAKKMESIGRLAGGIAHDFNNMLGGILGAAELLAHQLPEGSKGVKYQAMIVQSAKRAANLTQQLLAFSRTSPKVSSQVDLHAVINETLVLVRNTVDKRVQAESHLDAEDWIVTGDASLLQSMLLNLCINSCHAMPEGGTLVLATQVVELDEKTCEESGFVLQPGRFLQVLVQDNGEGIAPESLPRIFDPFFTTKQQGSGTGLGLASAYGTVQQHNGAIHVDSEVNKGTTFTLHLPLSGMQMTNSQTATPAMKGTGRILVVDDEKVVRTTALEMLEDLGYAVLSAEDGREAIRVFQREYEEIDLVLLDMIMPEMNGKDCLRALQGINPTVKVILSSGFVKEEDLKSMVAEGLKGFIRKPYTRSALSQVLHGALNPEIPPAVSGLGPNIIV